MNSRSCQKATLIRIRLTYAKPVWMLDGNIRESAEPAIPCGSPPQSRPREGSVDSAGRHRPVSWITLCNQLSPTASARRTAVFGAAADSLAVEEPAVPIWLIGACSAGDIGRQRPVPGAAAPSRAAIMACAAKWP